MPLFRAIGVVVLSLFLFGAPVADAAPVTFTIDTSSFVGSSGAVVFDFIDGGSPANVATVSNFSTDGTLGSAFIIGDVSGTLLGAVQFGDQQFFNELLQELVFGTSFTFSLSTTSGAADQASLPDGFSVFLLDSNGNSIVQSSDPTGANAIFLVSLGEAVPLKVFSANLVTVQNSVPEPSSIELVAASLIILGLSMVVNRRSLRSGLGVEQGRARPYMRAMIFASCICSAHLVHAAVADATNLTATTRSGLVFNRVTNTFDATVSFKNVSPFPIGGLVHLSVSLPAGVSLANATTVVDGRPAVLVSAIAIAPGANTPISLLKFSNPNRISFAPLLYLRGDIPELAIGLPPDPGVAGKSSVAGVDANGNGVRDDVERWIVFGVQDSARKRANLMVYAAATQQGLLSATKDVAVAAAKARISVIECYDFLGVPKEQRRWREVLAIVLNTEARIAAFDDYQDKINGEVFGLAAEGREDETCRFNVESLPN